MHTHSYMATYIASGNLSSTYFGEYDYADIWFGNYMGPSMLAFCVSTCIIFYLDISYKVLKEEQNKHQEQTFYQN